MSETDPGTQQPSHEPVIPAEPVVEPTAEPTTPAEPAALGVVPPAEPSPEPGTPAEPPPEPVSERVVPGPSEYKLPEGMDPRMGEFAHTNQFTQEQLDASMQHFGSIIIANQTAEREKVSELGTEFISTWGDKAEGNLALANRALTVLDKGGELTEMLNKSGYGGHPAILKHFLAVGEKLKEGGFLKGETNSPKNLGGEMAHRFYPDQAPKS